jgi:hypothetical protein
MNLFRQVLWDEKFIGVQNKNFFDSQCECLSKASWGWSRWQDDLRKIFGAPQYGNPKK